MYRVYKPIGYTPSMLMKQLFQKCPELASKKYSFYGKLDPMAHGMMLILFDDECSNPIYLNLDKTYRFYTVLGINTDTYDLMGKIVAISPVDASDIHLRLNGLTGKIEQKYPPYSYLKIKGHPLWWWSQNGRLDEVAVPSKTVEVYSLDLIGNHKIAFDQLKKIVTERVSIVEGEFRQKDIIRDWNEREVNGVFDVVHLSARVSSGTYVRNLANMLNGFALEIHRPQVGEYDSYSDGFGETSPEYAFGWTSHGFD